MADGVTEVRFNLPENLTIPKYHGPLARKDFDDSCIFLLEPNDKGWLRVYTEDGRSFRIERPEDILLMFPNKYNWIYSKFNEIDCITKGLSKAQRIELKLLNETTFYYKEMDFTLRWIPGTGKMTLMEGKSTRTTRYLINSASYTSKHTRVETFEEIRSLVDKLKILDEFTPVSFISAPSTTKNFILGTAGREFKIVNSLSITDLSNIRSAYKGPRMETRHLGTLQDRDNIDMVKAYLHALAKTPAFYRNVVDVFRGPEKFFENAHPGSAYHVITNVPRTYDKFSPVSIRLSSGTYYPHGEFLSWQSKPVIDQIIKLGDIPFKIVDSIQFILLDENNFPFKKGLDQLAKYEDENKESLSPIYLKSLHNTMVGNFLNTYEETDKETGEIREVASGSFHPSLSLAMQGLVATELWEMSQTCNTDAIRVDALTGKGLPGRNGFKKKDKGMMTFLSAHLKDHPGLSLYRDHIERDRDKSYVTFDYTTRISFAQGYYTNSTGKLVDVSVRIAPTAGNRYIDRPERIGELLTRELSTRIPTIEQLGEEDTPQCRTDEDRLDLYLRLFHRTQI